MAVLGALVVTELLGSLLYHSFEDGRGAGRAGYLATAGEQGRPSPPRCPPDPAPQAARDPDRGTTAAPAAPDQAGHPYQQPAQVDTGLGDPQGGGRPHRGPPLVSAPDERAARGPVRPVMRPGSARSPAVHRGSAAGSPGPALACRLLRCSPTTPRRPGSRRREPRPRRAIRRRRPWSGRGGRRSGPSARARRPGRACGETRRHRPRRRENTAPAPRLPAAVG